VKFVLKKGDYDTELSVFWGSLFKIFMTWRKLFWFLLSAPKCANSTC